MNSPRPFFKLSQDACAQITQTFDFFSPAAVALWNLRWQVRGYTGEVGSVVESDLQSRFVTGSGLRGAAIKHACIDTSWEEQKELFARYLLYSLFAIYESWLQEILEPLGACYEGYIKALQFPGAKGAGLAITAIRRDCSGVGKDVFKPTLILNRRADINLLEKRLYCYRFFKEVRNCFIHGGGRAGQEVVDAYNAYIANVRTSADMGVNELPKHVPPVLGAKLELPLRGVIGFSEIIIDLILTLDAEFVCLEIGERELLAKWRLEINANRHPPIVFKTTPIKRVPQIQRVLKRLEIPRASAVPLLDSLLLQHRLLPF